MDDGATFGGWLKARRKDYGYTQRELAGLVGCSSVTIEKIEEGKNRPSRQLAELLAKALEVPASEVDALVRFARAMPRGREQPSNFNIEEAEQAPAPPPVQRPNNLPGQLTPLVGRAREVDEVCVLLRRADVRLVSLTGPGGIGKTRLALQVAVSVQDDFRDGVFFVPLVNVIDPGLVGLAVSEILGVKEAPGRTLLQSLKDYLLEKQMLLVLDNFEQVIAAANTVVEVLTAAPGLKMLVTSREVLQVRGERQYPVDSLELPDIEHLQAVDALLEYPSIALFVERAQGVKDDFELTEDNSQAVAVLVHRLEGVPLSIELAAARVKLFQPQALLSRLDNSLKLLTGGHRDLPARHQTLRDTIEWSYNLLSPEEQALFARLGVFVGGWTLEAVEAVCGDSAGGPGAFDIQNPLDVLESLLDKSLLKYEQQTDELDVEPRFTMLGIIREYALERLRERDEESLVRRRHAEYYASTAVQGDPELNGGGQILWLDRFERDHDNFRAAMSWALANSELMLAARIGGSLWRFWYIRGHFSEGRQWLEQILQVAGPEALPPRLHAQVLNGAGWLAHNQGDYDRAAALAGKGVEIARRIGDGLMLATGLFVLGNVQLERGDAAGAAALYDESLQVVRGLNHKWGMATVLTSRGQAALRRGDLDRAGQLLEESLEIAREIQDYRGTALSLLNLSMAARQQGDLSRAMSLLEESLEISRKLKDRRGISWALNDMSLIALEQGDWKRATWLLHESLALKQQLGDKENIAIALERLAIAALARDEAVRAVRLLGAMRALREAIGAPLPPDNQSHYFGIVAGARARMGEAEYAQAWAAGRAMTLEQAIAYALGDKE